MAAEQQIWPQGRGGGGEKNEVRGGNTLVGVGDSIFLLELSVFIVLSLPKGVSVGVDPGADPGFGSGVPAEF